jgi:hypothetical protein
VLLPPPPSTRPATRPAGWKTNVSAAAPPVRFAKPVKLTPPRLPAFDPVRFQVFAVSGPVSVLTPPPPFSWTRPGMLCTVTLSSKAVAVRLRDGGRSNWLGGGHAPAASHSRRQESATANS